MSATKISIGYGSDQRGKNPKNCYGTRSSGKKVINGGFCGAPTTDFVGISQEQWDTALPNSYKPSWMKNE
jgi:hypothetical protein